jgi:hypothetical protein
MNIPVKYKSDLTEGNILHPDAVRLKTLCTECQRPLDCHWPPEMTFAGKPCTPVEYISKALQHDKIFICCDDCLQKMPDVKIEDLFYE